MKEIKTRILKKLTPDHLHNYKPIWYFPTAYKTTSSHNSPLPFTNLKIHNGFPTFMIVKALPCSQEEVWEWEGHSDLQD